MAKLMAIENVRIRCCCAISMTPQGARLLRVVGMTAGKRSSKFGSAVWDPALIVLASFLQQTMHKLELVLLCAE